MNILKFLGVRYERAVGEGGKIYFLGLFACILKKKISLSFLLHFLMNVSINYVK